MKKSLKFMVITLIFLSAILLSSCRTKEENRELSGYVNSSISTIKKRTGENLKEQGVGVYLSEGVMQVMAPKGKINSITLLENGGKYTFYQIKIGMKQEVAEPKLYDKFGKETSSTINTTKNVTTYSYMAGKNELYVSYDIDTKKVKEISYYKKEEEKKGEENSENTNSGELIAMIGDSRVYYNEAMVYLKSVQENYESEYGKDVWNCNIFGDGNSFGKLIKDEVIKQITELKVIADKANELGISLTEEEMAEAREYAKEHYEGLTPEDINKYFITRELLEKVYADNLLAEKVFENITLNVDTNVTDLEAKQVTVQHILIYSVDFDDKGNKIPLSPEEKEAAYEKARNLLEEAKTTDDFYSFAEANSEADTIEYTFGRNSGPKEYSAAFEQAAFTLKTGQVSDIISTDYGWHILYCVSDFNEDATTQVKEDIIEQRRNDMFSELYKEWSKDYDVIVNSEAWNAISYEN